MPKKSSKVTAVAINQPEGLIRAHTIDEDVITDAQHMTELVKAIDAEPAEVVQAEALPAEVVQEPDVQEEALPAVKPKAKRAPRVKKETVTKPDIEDKAPEVIADVEAPKEKSPKANTKVECPDCGKSMSAKTLRYSHGPNCLFRKQADKEERQMMGIPEEVIEAEVQKRMSCAKAERLSRRQKQIESLVANAF